LLAEQTGKTPDELLNQAIEKLPVQTDEDQERGLDEWRQALLAVKGMWKDRDDLDEFYAQIRREANRIEPPDEPL
jgi:hypothetical protein